MKKLILAAAVAGAVLLSSAAQAQTTPEGYQLQQVLMMSRHNLRAPLANNGSVLEQSTPNQWPEWDVPGGQLTTAPVLCPASARVLAVFHQGQPAQSALSAAVATVGGSESFPVILRPDELSEALMVGVNDLLSLYGIH